MSGNITDTSCGIDLHVGFFLFYLLFSNTYRPWTQTSHKHRAITGKWLLWLCFQRFFGHKVTPSLQGSLSTVEFYWLNSDGAHMHQKSRSALEVHPQEKMFSKLWVCLSVLQPNLYILCCGNDLQSASQSKANWTAGKCFKQRSAASLLEHAESWIVLQSTTVFEPCCHHQ